MLPESITEQQILDLKIYKPLEEENGEDCEEEKTHINENDDKLKEGFILTHGNIKYTIHKFLNHGSFGYTYTALSNNITTDNALIVVFSFNF